MTTTATTSATTGAFAFTGTLRLAEDPAHSVSQAAQAEPRWYAAYTCAQHEKCVAEQLGQRSVEHFLPLYKSVRRWKDRRVQLELPLFPGYVFVRMPLRDRLRVLEIPSVAHLVSFNGIPAALPEEEIESLREALVGRLRAEPHPYLTIGRRVRITAGPLVGFEGILVRRKRSLRVVLSMNLVQRSIVVDADVADIEPILQERQLEDGREHALLL